MSSFIVDKKEFIKAAGLMHGIESADRHPHTWFLDHVKEMFEECYNLNVKSVSKQYHTRYKADKEAYDDLFIEYSKKGRYIWLGFNEKIDRTKLRYILINFFSCVDYQIEDEKMSDRANAIFYQCIYKLFAHDLYERDDLGYGYINIAA